MILLVCKSRKCELISGPLVCKSRKCELISGDTKWVGGCPAIGVEKELTARGHKETYSSKGHVLSCRGDATGIFICQN